MAPSLSWTEPKVSAVTASGAPTTSNESKAMSPAPVTGVALASETTISPGVVVLAETEKPAVRLPAAAPVAVSTAASNCTVSSADTRPSTEAVLTASCTLVSRYLAAAGRVRVAVLPVKVKALVSRPTAVLGFSTSTSTSAG